MGNQEYIDSTFSQVTELSTLNNYEVKIKSLTPKMDEFSGWGLVEIKPGKITK